MKPEHFVTTVEGILRKEDQKLNINSVLDSKIRTIGRTYAKYDVSLEEIKEAVAEIKTLFPEVMNRHVENDMVDALKKYS